MPRIKELKKNYIGKTIKKWLKSFYRRFFTQQFKRSCQPDGVKALPVSLSPRTDWRMPSEASYMMWMAEIEALERQHPQLKFEQEKATFGSYL